MKRNALTLIFTTLFSLPSFCYSSEFSYDFIQFSLSRTSFEGRPNPESGYDLDLKKSVSDRVFVYGSFGTGSVGTTFGGIEVPDLIVGIGLGAGYHFSVFGSRDFISTIEMHQIDTQPGTVPVSMNAFNTGIGLRSKLTGKTEGSLFASYSSIRDEATYSLDLQLDYKITSQLQLSGGIDLMNFNSMTLGLRSAL